MCVLAYGTSSPSMASMPGCSAVRGCGSSSISVALTYSRKGASACLPDVRSTNVLSASQRPTRRMTSKSTQPSSKSARGASCAEVVSQRVLHAHTEKNGASSVRHASLPFGLKRSPPAYCRCASISQRAHTSKRVSPIQRRCSEPRSRSAAKAHSIERKPWRRRPSAGCETRITSSRCRPPQQRRRAAATGPVGSPAALSGEAQSRHPHQQHHPCYDDYHSSHCLP
mmetsp:Transcript_45289/g.145718  ORF Transcript_45289/g.145718 Transcript_45289/m.145718 type:complete len:226 (+) Transcript_45289:1018-1695(+)